MRPEVTTEELCRAVQRTRQTIHRWGELGLFGELGYPTREGTRRGALPWTKAHLERARWIAQKLDENWTLADIKYGRAGTPPTE